MYLKGSDVCLTQHVMNLVPKPPPKMSVKSARWKILQTMQRQLLAVVKHYCDTNKLSKCSLYLYYVRSPNLNRLVFKTTRREDETESHEIVIEAGLDEALAYIVTDYYHPESFDLPADACNMYETFDESFIEDLVQQTNLAIALAHVNWDNHKTKHKRKPRPPLF